MPLPSERIYFKAAEGRILRAGLNVLVSGVETIRINGYLSKDLFFPGLGSHYLPREFDAEIAMDTRSLFGRIIGGSNRNKIELRANYFRTCTLQLSLRVSRRSASDEFDTTVLERKLEAIRKRLKRAIQSRLGLDAYSRIQLRWKRHSNWLRLNVLMKCPPRRPSIGWRYLREQCEQILTMARAVIAERCLQPLPERELHHLVTLAIRHVRRGRYEIPKLRLLLRDELKTRQFLFEFIRDRAELDVKYEFKSLDEQMAERSEKFKLRMVIEPTFNTWNPVVEDPVVLPPLPSPPAVPGVEGPKLAEEFCRFLLNQVENGYWDGVVSRSTDMVTFYAGRFDSPIHSSTIADVIDECRPVLSASISLELEDFWAEWSVRWLMVFETEPSKLWVILKDGHQMAESQWQRMDQRERTSRQREISQRYELSGKPEDPFDIMVREAMALAKRSLTGY